MIGIYGTCPVGFGETPATFARPIADVARWTEAAGLRGLLIFTDNYSMDPWAAAQFVVERTTDLVPMVAVQPAYMHPFTAARMVSTIGSLYGRRVDLNLVTGGYGRHMRAVGCALDHDERYDRLIEYGQIMAALLGASGSLDHRGKHYDMAAAQLHPPLPPRLSPRVFVAGSSPAATVAAEALDAVRLTYPRAIAEYATDPTVLAGTGIRVGIIARDTSEAAWRTARRRYPPDALGEAFRRAATKGVDAHWHHSLWDDSHRPPDAHGAYWLHPFRVSNEFCPYLVGSHAEVATALAKYLSLGITTLILNAPPDEEDVAHAFKAIQFAERISSATR